MVYWLLLRFVKMGNWFDKIFNSGLIFVYRVIFNVCLCGYFKWFGFLLRSVENCELFWFFEKLLVVFWLLYFRWVDLFFYWVGLFYWCVWWMVFVIKWVVSFCYVVKLGDIFRKWKLFFIRNGGLD